jgi:hypothetical protein
VRAPRPRPPRGRADFVCIDNVDGEPLLGHAADAVRSTLNHLVRRDHNGPRACGRADQGGREWKPYRRVGKSNSTMRTRDQRAKTCTMATQDGHPRGPPKTAAMPRNVPQEKAKCVRSDTSSAARR